MEIPKYQYALQTWGGFYDTTLNYKDGIFYFNTKEERSQYIADVEKAAKNSNTTIMKIVVEGYNLQCPVLHRVVEYKGNQVYSSHEMNIDSDFNTCSYHLEYKWTVGFNDYPFGEKFNYEKNNVKVIKEWISGSFKPLYDE